MVCLAGVVLLLSGCGGGPDSPDSGPIVADAGNPPDAGSCAPDHDQDNDGVCDDQDTCPAGDDHVDADGDGVPDACDKCPGFDDHLDSDGDGIPDGCDKCPMQAGNPDADGDGVCDSADKCPGHPDGFDSDADGVPDGCDICPGSDDNVDQDHDGVPDGCDICPLGPNDLDSDGDGVADACDQCPGHPDGLDLDLDGVPDGCDLCFGINSTGDTDMDGVCDSNDYYPGADDKLLTNPLLPGHGHVGGGSDMGSVTCPGGAWAVGVGTADYDDSKSVGAELICKNASGTETRTGQTTFGSAASAPLGYSTDEYDIRCDTDHSDGRMIGSAVRTSTNDGVGRYGAICSSASAGLSWVIQPASVANSGYLLYLDLCNGPGEVIRGIETLRAGWWNYLVQFRCAVP
jgi:hypothetical protein